MSLEKAIEENTLALRELIATLRGTQLSAEKPVSAHAVENVPSAETVVEAKPTKHNLTSNGALRPWADKTKSDYEDLKGKAASLDSVRQALLAINAKIGRPQANAVLARFGATAITTRGDKKGLTEEQYPEVLTLALQVLAGEIDAEGGNG